MAKYLDQTGLSYFWGKIKGFVNSHEHPVGSVYITISSSFNPANQWGGTWSKIAEGQCLIQAGSTYALGSAGGETTHQLTFDEMPKHSHGLYGADLRSGNQTTTKATFTYKDAGQSTSYISGILGTELNGADKAHNNMPPYLAVNIWKRTA